MTTPFDTYKALEAKALTRYMKQGHSLEAATLKMVELSTAHYMPHHPRNDNFAHALVYEGFTTEKQAYALIAAIQAWQRSMNA